MTPSDLEFYGLAEPPFSLTSDPRFIYESRGYSIARSDVTTAVVNREGLVIITGGLGTGKTSLCRALIQQLGADTRLSAIPSPLVSARELLSQIVGDFGLLFAGALDEYLISLVPLGAHAVVIIDEAQQLEPGALEEIRRLASLEAGGVKLMQIILVGEPELRGVIARNAPELDHVVSRRCVLRPLAPDEVGPYLERRLEVAKRPETAGEAAAPEVEFSSEAVDAIAKLTRGVPRMINRLADRALDVAAGRQERSVAADAVFTAADRLQMAHDRPAPQKNTRLTAMLATAAVLAVAAVGVWSWVSRSKSARQPAASRAEAVAPSTLPPAGAGPPASTGQPPAAPAVVEPAPLVGTVQAVESVMVTVASFGSEDRANTVMKSLQAKGLPAFSRLDARRRTRSVLVGPYVTREEALDAKKTLDQLSYRAARVIVEPPPSR